MQTLRNFSSSAVSCVARFFSRSTSAFTAAGSCFCPIAKFTNFISLDTFFSLCLAVVGAVFSFELVPGETVAAADFSMRWARPSGMRVHWTGILAHTTTVCFHWSFFCWWDFFGLWSFNVRTPDMMLLRMLMLVPDARRMMRVFPAICSRWSVKQSGKKILGPWRSSIPSDGNSSRSGYKVQ